MKTLTRRRASQRRDWYLTASYGMYASVNGTTTWVPGAPVHLKRLGVMVTACGVPTTSWQVFWLEDPYTRPDVCTACVKAHDTTS